MKEYVTYKDLEKIIEEHNPQYIILLSGRNDGKSYAVKEKCLNDALQGKLFHYMRRYEIDLKRADPLDYWRDFVQSGKISEMTGGEFSGMGTDGKRFYLINTDKDGKEIKGPIVGRIHALSVARSLKSGQYPDCENIIYEEFISDSGYLYREPDKLQQYVSTIFRDRRGHVFLVGNTISRLCPYFSEWQLNGINKMKPGQVDIYNILPEEDGEIIKIAVHVPNVGGDRKRSGMFFGKSSAMITGQSWDCQSQPHLKDKRICYNERYTVVFDPKLGGGMFLLTLLQHATNPASVVWYVEPKTSALQANTRYISPDMQESPLWSKDFTPLNAKEKKIFNILKMGKVAYSDNLTGTEFKRAMRMYGKEGTLE